MSEKFHDQFHDPNHEKSPMFSLSTSTKKSLFQLVPLQARLLGRRGHRLPRRRGRLLRHRSGRGRGHRTGAHGGPMFCQLALPRGAFGLEKSAVLMGKATHFFMALFSWIFNSCGLSYWCVSRREWMGMRVAGIIMNGCCFWIIPSFPIAPVSYGCYGWSSHLDSLKLSGLLLNMASSLIDPFWE